MAQVILKNVWKRFDSTAAVKDVNLHIEDKEFCVLVGPSGCGKSTTLRIVAGLEEATEGDVYIGDRRVNDVPPKDRDIAMVFQNYALYPHMTVYQNMAFGLKLRGYSKKEIDTRVKEAAAVLNISNLLDRKPKALSGGQRQRVALGRAIVRKPKVFLFDEPLSNLDAKLRVQMRTELAKLHDQLQTTMIYVTHDQVEAMTLGDRVCIMRDGVIQQVEDPLDIYNHPENKFVAGFIGSPPMNFLDVTIQKRDDGVWLDEERFSVKVIAAMEERLASFYGKKMILGIRPEDIHDKLYHTGVSSDSNTVLATVEVVEPMGSEIYLHMNTGRHTLVGRVDSRNQAKEGQDIELVFSMNKIHLFDKETEQAII